MINYDLLLLIWNCNWKGKGEAPDTVLALVKNVVLPSQDRPQPVISNGSKLITVGRTSKEVGRAKHELARSYCHLLACNHVFLSLEHLLCDVHTCNKPIRPFTLSKKMHFFVLRCIEMYWDQMFHRWENLQNVGQNPSRSTFSHCWPLGFLSSPNLVMSGNSGQMLQIYTSSETSGSVFYLCFGASLAS